MRDHEAAQLCLGFRPNSPSLPKPRNDFRISGGLLPKIRRPHACLGKERINFREKIVLVNVHDDTKISSLADMSSILYEGRARVSVIADIPGMSETSWKARLASGIKAKGKNPREVSIAAGKGPGYVHSILKEGKDPTIQNLLAVCEAADLSLTWVLFGFDISRETEEIVRELEASPPTRREGLLQFLRSATPPKGPPSDGDSSETLAPETPSPSSLPSSQNQ